MARRSTSLANWEPHFLSILRIVSGLLLLQHGAQKILGFPPGGRGGVVDLSTLAGVNRRLKGTPYRRAIGTPLWCAACR